MSDSKGAAIRDTLIQDLERYKNFGTPFTEDMADHILALLAQEVNKARIDELKELPITRPSVGIPSVSEGYIVSRIIELERLG